MSDLHKESRSINQVMKSQDELVKLQAENVKMKNLIKDICKVDNFARPRACVLLGRCWAAELTE